MPTKASKKTREAPLPLEDRAPFTSEAEFLAYFEKPKALPRSLNTIGMEYSEKIQDSVVMHGANFAEVGCRLGVWRLFHNRLLTPSMLAHPLSDANKKKPNLLFIAIQLHHQQTIETIIQNLTGDPEAIETETSESAAETSQISANAQNNLPVWFNQLLVAGKSIVHHASLHNNLSAMRFFLSLPGVLQELDRLDDLGHSALSYAILNRHYDMITLLIEAGTNPHAQLGGKHERTSPFELALLLNDAKLLIALDGGEEKLKKIRSTQAYKRSANVLDAIIPKIFLVGSLVIEKFLRCHVHIAEFTPNESPENKTQLSDARKAINMIYAHEHLKKLMPFELIEYLLMSSVDAPLETLKDNLISVQEMNKRLLDCTPDTQEKTKNPNFSLSDLLDELLSKLNNELANRNQFLAYRNHNERLKAYSSKIGPKIHDKNMNEVSAHYDPVYRVIAMLHSIDNTNPSYTPVSKNRDYAKTLWSITKKLPLVANIIYEDLWETEVFFRSTSLQKISWKIPPNAEELARLGISPDEVALLVTYHKIHPKNNSFTLNILDSVRAARDTTIIFAELQKQIEIALAMHNGVNDAEAYAHIHARCIDAFSIFFWKYVLKSNELDTFRLQQEALAKAKVKKIEKIDSQSSSGTGSQKPNSKASQKKVNTPLTLASDKITTDTQSIADAQKKDAEEKAKKAEAEKKDAEERAKKAEAEKKDAEERAKKAEAEKKDAEERAKKAEAEKIAAEAKIKADAKQQAKVEDIKKRNRLNQVEKLVKENTEQLSELNTQLRKNSKALELYTPTEKAQILIQIIAVMNTVRILICTDSRMSELLKTNIAIDTINSIASDLKQTPTEDVFASVWYSYQELQKQLDSAFESMTLPGNKNSDVSLRLEASEVLGFSPAIPALQDQIATLADIVFGAGDQPGHYQTNNTVGYLPELHQLRVALFQLLNHPDFINALYEPALDASEAAQILMFQLKNPMMRQELKSILMNEHEPTHAEQIRVLSEVAIGMSAIEETSYGVKLAKPFIFSNRTQNDLRNETQTFLEQLSTRFGKKKRRN